MAFDATPLSSIGDNFNPAAAQQQAYTLKSYADENQLNQLKLGQAKTQQADTAKAKDILSKADISTPEGLMKASQSLAQAGLSQQAMDLLKESQNQKATNQQYDEGKLKILQLSSDVIGPAALQIKQTLTTQGPAMAQAQYTQLMAQLLPQIPADIRSRFPAQPPQDPQQFSQLLDGAINGSEHARQILSQQLATRKEETSEKSEAERERHNREQETQGQAKVGQGQQKIDISRGKDGGLTTESTDSLADQAMAGDTTALQGLKAADKIKVRNRIADLQQIRGLSGADQAAANAQFAGVKAGERTLGTRQANIDMAVQEAQNIEPILREASAKVPRGGFVPWTKLFQIAESGSSNKDLLAFAQAAKSFANIYTRATVPGASAVADREAAVEHLPTFTSDESFQAVLNIMDREMTAAKQSPGQVRKDMSAAITGRSEAPPSPGQTPNPGAPPAGAATVGGQPAAPHKIASDADYNALPSGATFLAPDGSTRKKP